MREAVMTREEDSRETAVVVATVLALVLALVYWISRIGFNNAVPPVAKTLGLSLFLVAAPLEVAKLLRRNGRDAWWSSQSFAVMACIAVSMSAGMIARNTGVRIATAFVLIGFAAALWNLFRWLGRGSIGRSMGLVIVAAAFAVWCAGVVWGSRYKMPLFWETLSLNSNIHHDTFYYASMANMLDTYGVPTTGLDGIPLIRYHFGSTWLYAQWAHLLGSDVLTFYSLGYPVIVLPVFVASLLLFAAKLGASLRDDWRAWLVLIAATVGFIPTDALEGMTIWNSNALISESYLIGMALLFLVMGTCLVHWRNTKAEQRNASSSLFFLGFVPAAIVILGLLKVSLMVLALGVAIYLLWRCRLYRRGLVIGSAVVALVAFAWTFRLVTLPAQNTGISPLDFMRFNTAEGWQQFFLLFHFLWTWAYIGGRLWEEKAYGWVTLKTALGAGRLIDAEAVAAFALLGFLPGAVFSIYGGSAVYFSDVQRWIAVALIMGRLPAWSALWEARRAPREKSDGIRVSTVMLAIFAAPFVVTMLVNFGHWPARVVRANLDTRRQLARGAAYEPVVTALRDISHLPRAERKLALLFIPQSNRQYWSMFTADGRCTFTPLIAPGIASVAMLDGMPSYGCKVTEQYNMNEYNPRTKPQTPEDVTDASLCAKTRSKGFREVIVLDAVDEAISRPRRIDCYLQSQ